MKDIYELLNEVEIDEKEFIEVEVNKDECFKVKKALQIAIQQKEKKKRWWKKAAIAAIVTGISVTMVGLTVPSYAGNIPIIGDIFRFFDNNNEISNQPPNQKGGKYEHYKEYSNALNLVQEDNGIKFTVNDAIFDGKIVTLTYTIESAKDLGDNPQISFPTIKKAKGVAGTGTVSRIDRNKYVGILTASNISDVADQTVTIDWKIDKIRILETNQEIKGQWKFNFTLDSPKNNLLLVNQSVKKVGVIATITKLTISPMSFTVYYDREVLKAIRNQFDAVDIDIEIKDNLGNRYEGQGNGGKEEENNLTMSKTFGKLNENAKQLIITPHITFRNFTADTYGGVEISENGDKKMIIPSKSSGKSKELVMDEIIIDIND
ncbi:DUF4179 domain-containing protein [Heyndrickxia oleronia]|uniref:DUF4179 domain-containing protein n=1 Tax=Heyndrickxia oleronia TaxID=38875 RepID=A0AAW6SYY4_9BACI|nr:DUF4179 domain-containing protein [Heyndrickxia oleronia]MDH5162518.1 DUF4179 domain-containing protein [Heyndrickxia oleronia]